MSILLLRYAKSRLLLNIDGDVKEFFDNDDKTMSKAFPDNLIYETEDVTNSFSSYLAIIGIGGMLCSGSHKVVGTVIIRTSNYLTATQQNDITTNIMNSLIALK